MAQPVLPILLRDVALDSEVTDPEHLSDKEEDVPPEPPVDVTAQAAPLERRTGSLGSRLGRRTQVFIATVVLVGATAGTLAWLKHKKLEQASTHGLSGDVSEVVTAGGGPGLELIIDGVAKPLRRGDKVQAGSQLRTDGGTWAKVGLEGGGDVVLDRGGDVVFEAATKADRASERALQVRGGSALLQTVGKNITTMRVPFGTLTASGARVAVTVAERDGKSASTSIVVARGSVVVVDSKGHTLTLGPGDSARLSDSASAPTITKAAIERAFARGELDEVSLPREVVVSSGRGLGSLRGRVAGATGEGDATLRLAKHNVHVRLDGDSARTEVDETFQSDDSRVLEGIFHFAVPTGASLELLELEVDGKMEPASFVEREKAAAIWKGVLFVNSGQTRAPGDSIRWIESRFTDPALLEFRAGGRLELRVFPIPAKSSRRVRLAYTERLPAVGDARRYTYPLPHLPGKMPLADSFSFTVESATPVRGLAGDAKEIVPGRAWNRGAFVPAGDISLEVDESAGSNPKTRTRAWTADSLGTFVSMRVAIPHAAKAPAADGSSGEGLKRPPIVLVVDSSRSMLGERWNRATLLTARIVEELTEDDRISVLSCDVTCTSLGATAVKGGKKGAHTVAQFLSGISPDGGSDLGGVLANTQRLLAGTPGQLIYIGDGAPSIGARSPSDLEKRARSALSGVPFTAVAVGLDADLSSLKAIASGADGLVLRYLATDSVGPLAASVVASLSGDRVHDVTIKAPAGLVLVDPPTTLREGDELLLAATSDQPTVSGELEIVGKKAGKLWSMSAPFSATASRSASDREPAREVAVKRIALLERVATGEAGRETEPSSRAEVIALSRQFFVPSRSTSLLALENPVMAAAFGTTISRFGETEAAVVLRPVAEVLAPKGKDVGPTTGTEARKNAMALCGLREPVGLMRVDSGAMPLIGERTHAYCAGHFSPGAELPKTTVERGRAETDLNARFGWLARGEILLDARTLVGRALAADPTHADWLIRRADLSTEESTLPQTLRMLTGILDEHPNDADLADRLAELARIAKLPDLTCALLQVRVDTSPLSEIAKTRLANCREPAVTDATVFVTTAKGTTPKISARASWKERSPGAAAVDVDIVIVDPVGQRHQWRTASAEVSSPTSSLGELVTLSDVRTGLYSFEVVRAPGAPLTPVDGQLDVTLPDGGNKKYTFRLDGTRAVVGHAELAWADQRIPIYGVPRRPWPRPRWEDPFLDDR